MKKFICFFLFFLPVFMTAKNSLHDKKIKKIIEKYQNPMNAVLSCVPNDALHDEEIIAIFQQIGFFGNQEIIEITRSIAFLKKCAAKKEKSIAKHKKLITISADIDSCKEMESLIRSLEKLKTFLVEYGASYYAFLIHQEIISYYRLINEQNLSSKQFVAILPAALGISPQGRWLYFLVKKIDVDLRRLTSLFRQDILSNELIVALHRTKEKLIHFKNKIVETHLYKAQLSKTRWLKFVGVFIVPICFVTFIVLPIVAIVSSGFMPAVVSPIYISSLLCMYPLMCIPVTVHELKESSTYNIPVHSHSLFSFFMPSFFLLTWIPRD